jgi:hypothetical protein
MTDTNPARAIGVVKRVEMMCDFMENPIVTEAIENGVPVTMPRLPGALGFDVPLWVGLGIVGLWAALDAFSERAALDRRKCTTCKRICILGRYEPYIKGNEGPAFAELDDFRHLYAHNFAGEVSAEYFKKKRHVLAAGTVVQLTCGAQFNGQRLQLDLPHLRFYSRTIQNVLKQFS